MSRLRSAAAVYRYGRNLHGWICRDCRRIHRHSDLGRLTFAAVVLHTAVRHHRLPRLEPIGYTATFRPEYLP